MYFFLDGKLVHRRVTSSIKLASANFIQLDGEPGNVRAQVKCLAQ